jgi:hypothetical protein
LVTGAPENRLDKFFPYSGTWEEVEFFHRGKTWLVSFQFLMFGKKWGIYVNINAYLWAV